MNLKSNLLKNIISLIGGIILGSVLISINNYYNYLGKGEEYISSMPPTTIGFLLVTSIILIYLIWSLIQKKK